MNNIDKMETLTGEIANNLEALSILLEKETTDFEEDLFSQLAEEKDLPDIEELTWKFATLSNQIKNSNIIDGYKIWTGRHNELNVIVNNRHLKLNERDKLNKTFSRLYEYMAKDTVKEIIKWYIDQM